MATTVTKRISGAASGGQTVRVAARPAGGLTSRIAPNFLALEGDESGYLQLEGDMQTGDDVMKLEGDEALLIEGTVTKRVADVS